MSLYVSTPCQGFLRREALRDGHCCSSLFFIQPLPRAWPKHLKRNPKVSFAVLETEPPFAAVLIKGQAELIVNGADHWAEVRRITERYIAAAEVDAYIEPWSMLDTMCVIHPEKFISWERGY